MNLTVCDQCKDRAKPAKRAALFTGRYQDDPCDGRTRVYEHVDLCLDCAVTRLQKALYDRDKEL